MPPVTRPRIALLLSVAFGLATVATACSEPASEPPPGVRIVASGPAEIDAASVAATQAARSSPTSVPATPTVVAVPPTVSLPIARAASPEPTAAVSDIRQTTTATFMVTNTLGKGMALRTAPVARTAGRVWPDGTRMAGLGAEQEAYGWTWRWVRDPEGNIGWMPSNYLVQDESVPVSRGNGGGLLPPSAPPTLILVPTMREADPMPAAWLIAGGLTPVASPAAIDVAAPAATPPALNAQNGAQPGAQTLPAILAPAGTPQTPPLPQSLQVPQLPQGQQAPLIPQIPQAQQGAQSFPGALAPAIDATRAAMPPGRSGLR